MITAIENAILARIKAAQDAPGEAGLGYKLKKLDTYAGEFDDAIDRIVRDFPAVLVAYSGGPLHRETRTSYEMKGTFGLICCATSLRNEKAARHGKDGAVGSYQLVMDMLGLLVGQTLGLNITPLKPVAIRPVINDKAGTQLASAYALDFETIFTVNVATPASLDDFATFHADWDIPPFGNVGPSLPAEEADATDHLSLPTQGDHA